MGHKILIISEYGDTAALAQRLTEEGHDARVYICDKKFKPILNGIVQKVESGAKFDPDVVVYGETGLGKSRIYSNYARGQGYPSFGGSVYADVLEHNRFAAIKLAHDSGIPVPDTWEFDNYRNAQKFLAAHDDTRYICKVNDGNEFTSFMGKTNEDVANYLAKEKPTRFILQQFIDGLLEMNCELWFSHGKPIDGSLNCSMEEKKFLSGDMGPNVGCSSTLVWKPKSTKLVEEVWNSGLLNKIEDERYTGPLDIALMLDRGGKPYFLEFTPRFGINAVFALVHILKSDLGEVLVRAARGEAPVMDLTDNEYAFALTVSIPPYPYEIDALQTPNISIDTSPISDDNVCLWGYDITAYDGAFYSAGLHGKLFDITTSSVSPSAAAYFAKEAAKSLDISNAQWRDDAGNKQQENIYTLETLGYL